MPLRHFEYREIGPWKHEDVERALRTDDVEALRLAVIGVSMHDDDWGYAQGLCVRLSSHPDPNVRGNAVLGFAHIARVHRQLDRAVVQPIIQRALHDEDAYVRGHADSAAGDTGMYLKWSYDDGVV